MMVVVDRVFGHRRGGSRGGLREALEKESIFISARGRARCVRVERG